MVPSVNCGKERIHTWFVEIPCSFCSSLKPGRIKVAPLVPGFASPLTTRCSSGTVTGSSRCLLLRGRRPGALPPAEEPRHAASKVSEQQARLKVRVPRLWYIVHAGWTTDKFNKKWRTSGYTFKIKVIMSGRLLSFCNNMFTGKLEERGRMMNELIILYIFCTNIFTLLFIWPRILTLSCIHDKKNV